MNTVKHPWPNTLDISEVDSIDETLCHLKGLAGLFVCVNVEYIGQEEFNGAARLLCDTVERIARIMADVHKRKAEAG